MCLLRFGNSYVIRKDKMSLNMNETSLFFWEVETHKIENFIGHGTNEKVAQSIWIMYFLHCFWF